MNQAKYPILLVIARAYSLVAIPSKKSYIAQIEKTKTGVVFSTTPSLTSLSQDATYILEYFVRYTFPFIFSKV
jgi:hypothetical protein